MSSFFPLNPFASFSSSDLCSEFSFSVHRALTLPQVNSKTSRPELYIFSPSPLTSGQAFSSFSALYEATPTASSSEIISTIITKRKTTTSFFGSSFILADRPSSPSPSFPESIVNSTDRSRENSFDGFETEGDSSFDEDSFTSEFADEEVIIKTGCVMKKTPSITTPILPRKSLTSIPFPSPSIGCVVARLPTFATASTPRRSHTPCASSWDNITPPSPSSPTRSSSSSSSTRSSRCTRALQRKPRISPRKDAVDPIMIRVNAYARLPVVKMSPASTSFRS